MTAPLDEAAVWRHLLEIEPGSAGEAGPIALTPDGEWTCSAPTTSDASTLLDVFAPLWVRERLAVGQLGQSLDGRIATEDGHSHYVNGPEDIRRLHRLRALAQAVVVGAGTVASDDPRLTVREVEGSNPVRVVLDPRGRLDPDRAVFTDGAARTLRVRAEEGGAASVPRAGTAGGAASQGRAVPGPSGPDARGVAGPAPSGRGADGLAASDGEATRPAPDAGRGPVELVWLPTEEVGGSGAGGFSPHVILAMLEERGIRRVLVEGGGLTVSRFLGAGALDRLHVSVAPLLIGSGRPSFTLPPVRTLDEALRPPVRHFRLGSDLLFDLALVRRGA